MGRRTRSATRCLRCRMPQHLCVCDAIPSLDVRTRVLLIMHRAETMKSTSTGNLALRALTNSELLVHGDAQNPLDLRHLDDATSRPMLLFPGEGAVTLTRELLGDDPRPITLIVPDGSWRQARKFGRRIPGLDRFEQVALPPGPGSRYRLRTENPARGLATLEAISRALGILESPGVQGSLDALLDLMVRRTLDARGVLGA